MTSAARAAVREVAAASPTSRPWPPRVAAWLAYLAGGIDLASAITPALRSRVEVLTEVVSPLARHAANAGTLIVGVCLVMVAHGLRRRKRRAWRAAMVLLAVSAVLNLLKGLDVEEAALDIVLMAGGCYLRREFYAVAGPRSRWRALWVALGLIVADIGIGLALFAVRQHMFAGAHPLTVQLRQILLGLVGMGGPLHFVDERSGDLVTVALGSLGIFTVITTIYLVLRPDRPVARPSAEDERRLRELLDDYGWLDSLGYFALRRDKSTVFSPSGKAAIAYRVVNGVMLAAGDPIGDPEAWPQAIREFLAMAHSHAWAPGVMGCSERGAEVWVREADLDALELGDEAVVEVCDFTLDGRAMRNVRQMVNRVERQGFVTRVRRTCDVPPQELTALQAAAEAWRGSDTERGFSMALGRFGDAGDRSCVVVTAHDMQGTLCALLHFVPWGDDGLSLDLMRRDRGAPPGLNELLIVAALRAAPDLKVSKLSLNFAVFRSALARGERIGAGPVLRAWRAVLLFFSRWFQIESLYRFNAKFRPIWYPRFVCYSRAADIPRLSLAALQAEAFVQLPRWLGGTRG